MLFGFLSLLCVLGIECVPSSPNALSVKCSSCSPLTTVGGGFRIFAFLQAAFYFEGSRAILHPVESRWRVKKEWVIWSSGDHGSVVLWSSSGHIWSAPGPMFTQMLGRGQESSVALFIFHKCQNCVDKTQQEYVGKQKCSTQCLNSLFFLSKSSLFAKQVPPDISSSKASAEGSWEVENSLGGILGVLMYVFWSWWMERNFLEVWENCRCKYLLW